MVDRGEHDAEAIEIREERKQEEVASETRLKQQLAAFESRQRDLAALHARSHRINNEEEAPLGSQIKPSEYVTTGMQLKLASKFLFETRQTFTLKEIEEACFGGLKRMPFTSEVLKKSPRINYDGNRFSYKPIYDLKNKDELLSLIREHPEGIVVDQVTDAYPTVKEDIQALKAAGEIVLKSRYGIKEYVALSREWMLRKRMSRKKMKRATDDLRKLSLRNNFLAHNRTRSGT